MSPFSRVATVLLCVSLPTLAGAQTAKTLVLPFRTVNMSDATAAISRDMLEHELQDRGLDIVSLRSVSEDLHGGPDACDEPECVRAIARAVGVTQVVYGSLSRLGEKILARIYVLRIDEPSPFFKEQLPATYEEELDTVMRRMAEGISSGRSSSDQTTVDSVILEETAQPRRRAMRPGFSAQTGLLFPTGDSYGREERLTNIQLMFKFEGRAFFMEMTPLMGFSWGDRVLDWTILDAFAAKIFGLGDFAPFVGAGLGLHYLTPDKDEFAEEESKGEGVAAVVGDIGVGLLAMRTWDFHFMVEARYRYAFDDFAEAGGGGAQGFLVTFGLSK